ncbi:putative hybrid NRPS/PKS enzyme [Lojkania enalia]|uniref:Hybrid NRPS/PKS enzyme n=1 Tax=Lojkania enalia TaxID=147567 RepID=A0A9P4N980_9PLEO|nr:putative hybrid NRPS/PKS enzyme [Didymosphaeria enalia]
MASRQKEPIAIIGSGCRFPGAASSPSKLWDLLREPRDVLQKIPIERFNTNGVYNPDGMYHGSTNVRGSYLLAEDYRHFDAQFFKIKPIEAHSMDPQQRILLETVYESLESAGQSITRLRGSNTAVYVGLMSEEYGDILSRDIDFLPTYFPTATARSIMSNRISYVFDWHGPCMTIDTACSSSLVAVHQAVQALRNGDAAMAIAAGSNLCIGSKPYISENKLNMLSPSSRSRMWDADADGYARGDGVAAVVLKTLSKALEDGDHIECLIRESGVNQDGHTQGITMPSQIAQESLIRETYAKAGLDLSKRSDRPQFFEAHGTGTPAGDPIEAEAIRNAFFRKSNDEGANDVMDDTLYVGSIKTVIGHTEGTAGIAALMKASLAMQHSTIPPNLLFNTLNPKIAPFYSNLKIPTSATAWPLVPRGQSKRASVNSFGFGGTNAHVILESYEQDRRDELSPSVKTAILPFTFSATSEKSLANSIEAFKEYLEANKTVDLLRMALTLNLKRSIFPFRRSFSAPNVDILLNKMKAAVIKSETLAEATNNPVRSKLLGVFTGQGAQWPAMGRELVQNSSFVRTIVERLQHTLDTLPPRDRPEWTIMKELFADADSSRLSEAAISQPLCTVIQIILVDILQLAGIHFDAVVGHSSGEIGAAYASGFLSADDALKIAYYRGVHSGLARGSLGEKGSMMAVGTTLEDAEQLCELDDLRGRISVAACNSPSSITLSGDIEALEEAEIALKDEGKFVRKLKVDTAYHSHHMLPCSGPYIQSLESCHIQIRTPPTNKTVWYSSVTGKQMSPEDVSLRSKYWCDNMTSRVSFVQAIQAALEANEPFVAAFEVGPHPALRGPALQSIQDISGSTIPYSGTLERAKDDFESLSDSLGFAFTYIPEDLLTFGDFAQTMCPGITTTPLKNLPTYAWEHDRIYWMESRLSRAFRTREFPIHELLGTLSHDGSSHELRWRNVLSPREVPWLHGHKLQGQIVFPGSGYISMAIEAARLLAGSRSIQLLELHDLVIGKAVVFESEQSTADVQFTLLIDITSDDGVEARFHLEGTTNQNSDDLARFCSGRLFIRYGIASLGHLPPRLPSLVDTVPVDTETFYKSLLPIGYEYSGEFKALTGMRRTTDSGTAYIRQLPSDKRSALLAHPAVVDCAIQALILALCWPGDNRLWSLHVPTKIKCLTLDLAAWAENASPDILLPVDASVTSFDNSAVLGDVEISGAGSGLTIMQLEGVEIVPFAAGSPENDARLFFDIRWGAAFPDGRSITQGARATKEENDLATLCERVAYFYLRKLLDDITEAEWKSAEWHFGQLKKFADFYVKEINEGRQPHSDKSWKNDTREEIYAEMASRWPDNIDLKLMRSVGENLAATIRHETTILEHMMHENVLNDFYVKGLGLDKYTDFLTNAVMQLNFRYANMDILEIGAGTGGVTKTIIKKLGKAFNSYTYTDISSGFFEKAQQVFRDHINYMTFKTLDVEKDPIVQGFKEASFDLVVCSLVLHATENLGRTLANVRRLLKPGGYLVMLEITNTEAIRIGFSMGGLPGWWLGHKDDRELNPCVPANRWDEELRKTGFAGIDTITPEVDTHAWLFSVILAKATDQRIDFLDRPLSTPIPALQTPPKQLILLGGATSRSRKLTGELLGLLQPVYERVAHIETAENLYAHDIDDGSTVLSITDLDEPVFRCFTQARLDGLRRLFEISRSVLWITKGARSSDPYAAMIVGFARTLTIEMPHLRLQFLHHEGDQRISAAGIAEFLLRLQAADLWEKEGGVNMLWTTEPEITLHEDYLTVPRLFASSELNDRYNSARRFITKLVDLPSTSVCLTPTKSGYKSLEIHQNRVPPHTKTERLVSVRVAYSSPLAIKIATDTCLFLAKGTIVGSGKWVIVGTFDLASEVTIPEKWAIPSDAPEMYEKEKLIAFGLDLLARYIVGRTPPRTTLLVHDPPQAVAQLIAGHATEKNLRLVLTTTATTSKLSGFETIFIHPRSTHRTVKSLLPKDVTSFVNFSPQVTGIGNHISQSLPKGVFKWKLDDLYIKSAYYRPAQEGSSIPSLTKAGSAYHEGAYEKLVSSIGATTIPVQEAANIRVSEVDGMNKCIDWTAPIVSVGVEPVDTRVSFKPDKTYILFGLSGQLGRSLTLYMARLGAKYIVLTSRKPAVGGDWLDKARELGADVRIETNDITNREALQTLIDNIRETMPPIAGVANGAMVLQDTAIADMTEDIMNRVLGPKVDGSRYLNEIFRETKLDFFILLSSIATIFGQHGQSNYTAANMFLNGLVAQRRKMGLAGSVMAIGAIMGIGYFSREVDELTRERVIQAGYRMMSERDFHLLFAETVLSGKPNGGGPGEIISGLREIGEQDKHAENPLFHHVVVRQKDVSALRDISTARIPLRTSIHAATTVEEIYKSIKEAFLHKLQIILQLDGAPNMESGAEELGIDSLVAVEIRSWFLKELMVDISVLKILGGSTVSAMIELSMDQLPAELTPNLKNRSNEIHNNHNNAPQNLISSEQSTLIVSSSASTISKDSENLAGNSTPTSLTSDSIAVVANRKEIMSFGQMRFWFLNTLLEDKTSFNITFMIELTGDIDIARLQLAFQKIASRHSTLRTQFIESDDGELMQEVLEKPVVSLEHRNVSSRQDVEVEYARLKTHEYDLENGDVLQATLLSRSSASHFLVLGYHHINMDSMSLQVMLKDLDKAYRGVQLSPGPRQYPDYAVHQRVAFQQGKMRRELAYWKKEFPDFPPVLPLLPFSNVRSRSTQTSYAHERIDERIQPHVAEAIRAVCSQYRITPFHFHLAAFKTLIMRFLKIDDMCVGMTDANRTELDELESLGLYLNILPLRFKNQREQKFVAAIKEAQSKVRNALANSRLPFDMFIEELKPERSMEYSPVFQAFIDYKPPIQEKPDLFGCSLGSEQYDVGQTPYDITLSIVDEAEAPAIVSFQLQSSLYTKKDTGILMRSYLWLLEQFALNPENDLAGVSLYNPQDIEEALRAGRGPIVENQWPETIVHRIEEMTYRYGRHPAIVDGSGTKLTFEELDARVNAVAINLKEVGVKEDSRVAVLQEPGFEWIVSLLATLRLGAVYVPLDLQSPPPRLTRVLNDCQATFILAHSATYKHALSLTGHESQVLNISSLHKIAQVTSRTPIIPSSGSFGFIVYTSGTTGTPKGALLRHGGMVNQIENCSKMLDVGPGSLLLQQTAFTFDLSILQALVALASGSCLVIASRPQRSDPSGLIQLILTQKIDVTLATPSEYLWWLENDISNLLKQSNLRTTFVGGEMFPQRLLPALRSLNKPELRIFNAYGPCESTIYSHMTAVTGSDDNLRIPLGATIQNTATYIVDEELNILPLGFQGEILLAGVGIAEGYINNDEQSRVRFLPDLFASPEFINKGWKKLYRTGDCGRMDSNGMLAISGRISGDTQVKLHGQRLELQDIEKNLLQTAGGDLKEAVVTVRDDAGAKFLVAHVSFATGRKPVNEKAYLQNLAATLPLPPYMRPSLLVPLDEMPVTGHFKLDRGAISRLPFPDAWQQDIMDEEMSETAQKMKRSWEKVLPKGISRKHVLGGSSDFFHVGGNSMRLVRLQREIKAVLGVDVVLQQLFQHSTLEEMVNMVESRGRIKDEARIDWSLETAIQMPTISDQQRLSRRRFRGSSKVVALTGSTGFLGRTLLRQLVSDSSISHIHCIAVRGGSSRVLPAQFLSHKVTVHYGDLTSPNLGLAPDDANWIFQDVDFIIHNAADVSFMKTYHSLRPINVETTKEIVRLASPFMIPVHYISTAGVAHFSRLHEFPEVSAASYLPPSDGSDGYTASKWASEVYLENANKHMGLPVWIHRPSSIMGENPAPTDLMANMLNYSLAMRAIPLLQPDQGKTAQGGFLDFIDVENVARDILACLETIDEGTNASVMRFIHHAGEMVLPMDGLGLPSDEAGSLGFEMLTLAEWTSRAREHGMNELVAEFLTTAQDGLLGQTEQLGSYLLNPRLLKVKSIIS